MFLTKIFTVFYQSLSSKVWYTAFQSVILAQNFATHGTDIEKPTLLHALWMGTVHHGRRVGRYARAPAPRGQGSTSAELPRHPHCALFPSLRLPGLLGQSSGTRESAHAGACRRSPAPFLGAPGRCGGGISRWFPTLDTGRSGKKNCKQKHPVSCKR